MNEMKFSLVLGLALALSGCTSMNVFKDSPSKAEKTMATEPDLEPAAPEPEMAPQKQASAGTLSATQIRSALSGKSWKWTGKGFSGVTLFADDGSSLIEVSGNGKSGTTTGKWEAKDGQLCESAAPFPVLPAGQPMRCRPISGGGSAYKVGSATFTLHQ